MGQTQAKAAAASLGDVPLTHVIISPYTRALQTALPILSVHHVPVVIMQEVRERTAFVCDVGRSPDLLAKQFPQHDFTHLPQRWWHEGIESAQSTIARADAFRTLMASRDNHETTLLVSHWAFLLALTGESFANGEVMEYDSRTDAPRHIDWNS